jgi:predicted ATP-grasp superfamily ATP-dependent carboligase
MLRGFATTKRAGPPPGEPRAARQGICSTIRRMEEIDVVIETLRRQRKDMDELLEKTNSSTEETAKLIDRIEELRDRMEARSRRG